MKIRIRHLIYIVVMVGVLLSLSRPVCLWRCKDWIWLIVAVYVALFVCELYCLIRKSHQIVAYLQRGDVDGFLTETEKELQYSRGSWRNCYLVNKSAGLYYKGDFAAAIELLQNIPVKKLPRMYRYLHTNNLLANLLGAEQVNAAGQLIKENPDVFVKNRYNSKFFTTIQVNLGAYKFYQGDYPAARDLIETNLPLVQSDISKAVCYYYLSRINDALGRSEEAVQHKKRARELGKNTYIEHV